MRGIGHFCAPGRPWVHFLRQLRIVAAEPLTPLEAGNI